MNKFWVFPCIKNEENDDYDGYVAPLANTSDVSFMLFFPISKEKAELINYILNPPENMEAEEHLHYLDMLSVYDTMVKSWTSGNRFLSGVTIDIDKSSEPEQDMISVKLIISDEQGAVDSIVKVAFGHAIILAAMLKKDILFSNELLDKLTPNFDLKNDEDFKNEDNLEKKITSNNKIKNNDNPPVDSAILNLAKKIMNGKIK